MLTPGDLVGLLADSNLESAQTKVSAATDSRKDKLPPLPEMAGEPKDLGPMSMEPDGLLPMAPPLNGYATFPEGTNVRDILSGKEGVVAKPPEGDFGDIVFVTFDNVTSAFRADQLEASPVAAPPMPPAMPEAATPGEIPPPEVPAEGLAPEAALKPVKYERVLKRENFYASPKGRMHREGVKDKKEKEKEEKEEKEKKEEKKADCMASKDFVVTNLKDSRRMLYSSLKEFASKNPTHAAVATHIGYIPRHWDTIVATLAKDGVVLKSKAQEFDVAEFIAKAMTPSEIKFTLASSGVRLNDINAALVALGEKPTVAKPVEDPGAGNQWVWNAQDKAWEQWPIGAGLKAASPGTPKCDQCDSAYINGVYCHEHGCPNRGKVYDHENQEWVDPEEEGEEFEASAKKTGLKAAKPEVEEKPVEGKPSSKLEMWKRPKDYMGENYPDYYIGLSQTRDSEPLERANFDALLEKLGGESEENGVIVARASHWAVGWVETILVHKDSLKVPELEKIMEEYAEYPVIDEDKLYQYEVEKREGDWESWGKDAVEDVLKKLGKLEAEDSLEDADKGLAHVVEEAFVEAWENSGGDLGEGDITEVITEAVEEYDAYAGTREVEEKEKEGQQRLPGVDAHKKFLTMQVRALQSKKLRQSKKS